jgi:hypothetical protein
MTSKFNPFRVIDKQIADCKASLLWVQNNRLREPLPYKSFSDILEEVENDRHVRLIYLTRKRLRIEYFYELQETEIINPKNLSLDDCRIWEELLNEMLQHMSLQS